MTLAGRLATMSGGFEAARAQRDGLVGRDQERARVLGSLRPGAFVVVTGEAGIGKTALVDDVVAHASDGGVVVRGATSLSLNRRFGLWRRPARRLGLALPEVDATLAPGEQADELVQELLDAAAQSGPVLFVLEDLQRADESSIDVLAGLVPLLVDSGSSVLASARGDELEATAAAVVARADRVGLGPLEADALSDLAGRWLGRAPTTLELRRYVSASGGNPLLVRELVADAGGLLGARTVEEVIDASLQRLSPQAAELIDVLAVGGASVPEAVVGEVTGWTAAEVHAAVTEATQAEVLVHDGDEHRFRHDLLGEVPRDRLGPARWRALHRALADGWRATGHADPAVVGHHLVAGADRPVDPASADTVRRLAGELASTGRVGDAVDLLATAQAAWRSDLDPATGAALAMDLGDQRWVLGEPAEAVAEYERANDLARLTGDVVLRARTEVGRRRRVAVFLPDPEGRQVLAELDAALDHLGDDPVRVGVKGMRSTLAFTPPADPGMGLRLAEDAVAMARRLGDPDVLLGALDRWGMAAGTPESMARFADVGTEVAMLARRTRRSDQILTGYDWRLCALARLGDLGAAESVLRELEALAVVSRSPMLRITTIARRAEMLGLRGDRTEAHRVLDRLAEEVDGVLVPPESLGVQIGPRASMDLVWGVLDDRTAQLNDIIRSMLDDVPSPFAQIATGVLDFVSGRQEQGISRARPWLQRPEDSLGTMGRAALLSLMCTAVIEFPLPDVAPALIEIVEPYHGVMLTHFDNILGFPADHHLAGLLLLVGDVDRAAHHARAAVDLAQRMASSALEARCLGRLAEVQEATGSTSAARATTARAEALAEPIGLAVVPQWRTGRSVPVPRRSAASGDAPVVRMLDHTDGGWWLVGDEERRPLPAIRGMSMIARLVADQGVEVSAGELAGRADVDAVPPPGDLGPALDARAKREYRVRIAELQDAVDEADAHHDPERAAQARLELDLLVDELQRAVGLGGRDRPQGSGNERDRVNVTRNIGRAVDAIEAVDPDVGGHLRTAIRTGHQCCYCPDPTSAIEVAARR